MGIAFRSGLRHLSAPGFVLAAVLTAPAPIAFSAPPAAAEPQNAAPDPGAIPADLAARWFAQARDLCRADGGRLWGRDLYGPILLVNPGTRAAAANRPDADGVLRPAGPDSVWTGTLPEGVACANTATDWGGRTWTMLLWPLPEDRYDRGRLLCHELFHQSQADLGLPMSNPENAHLDEATGRTWLRLEWRALAEALLRRDEDRARAARGALLFRAVRRSLLPAAGEHERLLEMNEGLAEYTGLVLSGLPEWALPDRAAARLARDETGDHFQRSFAYASGPAYGLLLDALAPGWRRALQADDDLGALLAAALGFHPPADPAGAAEARLASYDGDLVVQEERERQETRDRRLAGYRERLVDGPVLVLPAGSEVRYTFNPYGLESLPGQGQVFTTLQAQDAWGALHVQGGTALMVRNASGAVGGFRVPAPADIEARPLAGDGWTLDLAEGWAPVPGPRPGDYRLERRASR